MLRFDVNRFMKYILEGAAVAVAAFVIPRKKLSVNELIVIALSAAAVFSVLDTFAPAISSGARLGTGFGVGFNMVGGDEGESVVPGNDCGCADASSPSHCGTSDASVKDDSTSSAPVGVVPDVGAPIEG